MQKRHRKSFAAPREMIFLAAFIALHSDFKTLSTRACPHRYALEEFCFQLYNADKSTEKPLPRPV
jgi:hypothetical protein